MNESAFWSKVRKSDTCWIWHGAKNSKGYGHCWFLDSDRLAHRVSWELHNGKIPEGLFVLHKCDVPHCVRPDHLFLGTQLDNVNDMDRKGRRRVHQHFGERNSQCKLCKEAVLLIRSSDLSSVALANQFGVSKQLISNIRLRLNWNHI